MTSFYMHTANGKPAGLPVYKPAQLTLPSGHTIGCVHWDDMQLAEYGVLRVAGYDPEYAFALGGGTIGPDGLAIPHQQPHTLAYIKGRKILFVKAECSGKIRAVWPDYKQASASLGVYGPDAAAACRDWIATHIAACDEWEAALAACDDLDAIRAMPAPVWPLVDGEE